MTEHENNQVQQNSPQDKGKPAGKIIIAIAAVLAVLLIFGAGNGLFGTPVETFPAEVYSYAEEIGQSVTENGVTVTLEDAYTDGTTAYLQLRLELPSEFAEADALYGGLQVFSEDPAYEEAHNCSYTWSTEMEGTVCNAKLRFTAVPARGGQQFFANGFPNRVVFTDWISEVDPPAVIAEGEWTFTLNFPQINRPSKELVSTPIPIEEGVEVYSCILTPTHLEIAVWYDEKQEWDNTHPETMTDMLSWRQPRTATVLLQDGTIVEARGQSTNYGSQSVQQDYLLSEPVDLASVEAVQLWDAVSIPMG